MWRDLASRFQRDRSRPSSPAWRELLPDADTCSFKQTAPSVRAAACSHIQCFSGPGTLDRGRRRSALLQLEEKNRTHRHLHRKSAREQSSTSFGAKDARALFVSGAAAAQRTDAEERAEERRGAQRSGAGRSWTGAASGRTDAPSPLGITRGAFEMCARSGGLAGMSALVAASRLLLLPPLLLLVQLPLGSCGTGEEARERGTPGSGVAARLWRLLVGGAIGNWRLAASDWAGSVSREAILGRGPIAYFRLLKCICRLVVFNYSTFNIALKDFVKWKWRNFNKCCYY